MLNTIILKMQPNGAAVKRLTESVQSLEDQLNALTRIVLQQCKTVDDMTAQLTQFLNSGPFPTAAKGLPNQFDAPPIGTRGSKQFASLDPKRKSKEYTSHKSSKRTPCSVQHDPDYKPATNTSFTSDHLAFRCSKRRKGSSKKTMKVVPKAAPTNVAPKVIILVPHYLYTIAVLTVIIAK